MAGQGQGGPVYSAGVSDVKPRSLMQAISEIEQFFAAEIDSNIPHEALTTVVQFSFAEVGFKSALMSTGFAFFESLINFLALKGVIPIFGSENPALFDTIFSYVMNLSLPLAFSFLIGIMLFNVYHGNITKRVIKSFITGYVITTLFFTMFFFFILHITYYKWLTLENITSIANALTTVKIDSVKVFNFLTRVRGALIPSCLFATFVCICSCGVIAIFWGLGAVRAKRFETFLKEWK